MKKLVFSLFFLALLSAISVKGQVMWNLKGGIMPRSFYDHHTFGKVDDERENRIDWMAGLELEIPLNIKLNLETGLRYRNHYSVVFPNDEHNYDWRGTRTHLELPLRLTYKQPLGEHFMLHAGIGPYASYAVGEDLGDKWNNNLQVGLEPSIAINWKCLSLGASFNVPCFYKGYKDENKPVIMATLGIRFKSHVWKYVGATLLAIASVGASAAAVWPTNDGNSSYGYSSGADSYSSSSSINSGNSSSSVAEQQNYNTDKRTWGNYDGLLSAHFYGSRPATRSEVEQWQKQMKDLRAKWRARGKSFPNSSNEYRSTSNCPNTQHSH